MNRRDRMYAIYFAAVIVVGLIIGVALAYGRIV